VGVLVVAAALLVSAAPGAYAPTDQAAIAWGPGDLVDRARSVASRGGERTAAVPATSSATPELTAPDAAPDAAPGGAAGAPATPGADAVAPSPEPQAAVRPPAAPPAAPAAVPPADEGAAMSAEIVALTNVERAAAGLPALAVSGCATDQAAGRTALLVAEGRFEHDPLGPVLEACGSGTVGENLSLGYRSAAAAVEGWMASQGHRENLLRAAFTQIGVACTQGQRGWLCAQVFLG